MEKKKIVVTIIAVILLVLGMKLYTDKQKEKSANNVPQSETVEKKEGSNISENNGEMDVQNTELDNGFEPLEIEEDYTVELEEGMHGVLMD